MDADGDVTVYMCSQCYDPWDNWTLTETEGDGSIRSCHCGLTQWVVASGPSLDLGIVRDPS